MNDASDLFWLRLWSEPWNGAHPSWLRVDDESASGLWSELQRTAPAGLQLAHRFWMSRAGLDPAVPPPSMPQETARAQLQRTPWDWASMQQAALFLGMVAAASEKAFVRIWARDHPAALASASVPAWRRASAVALARPLRAEEDDARDAAHRGAPSALSVGTLERRGWRLIRGALDAAWPASWAWFGFRCDAGLLRRDPALDWAASCIPLASANARHVLRIWSFSGGAAASPPSPTSHIAKPEH